MQLVSFRFKRYRLAIRVVGKLFVPKSHGSVHVKGKLSFLCLISLKHGSDAHHPCGQGLAGALLDTNQMGKRKLRRINALSNKSRDEMQCGETKTVLRQSIWERAESESTAGISRRFTFSHEAFVRKHGTTKHSFYFEAL